MDIQPNVRKDGREVVFASNRTGTLGFQDIWVATRNGVNGPWSQPVNLGSADEHGRMPTRRGRRSPGTARRSTSAGRREEPRRATDIFISRRGR